MPLHTQILIEFLSIRADTSGIVTILVTFDIPIKTNIIQGNFDKFFDVNCSRFSFVCVWRPEITVLKNVNMAFLDLSEPRFGDKMSSARKCETLRFWGPIFVLNCHILRAISKKILPKKKFLAKKIFLAKKKIFG